MKAKLQITAAVRNSKTYLQSSYATPPFKVANITEDKTSAALRLMIMSSSPGMLHNDDYAIDILVHENAILQLQTQSYQRIYSMQGTAQQQVNVQLQKGASLVYIPHPSVPHTGASFINHCNIYLENETRLIWGEIITCGRQLKGEIFHFNKYHSITKIFINNKLALKENLLLQPGLVNISGMGLMEGYTHQASLIYLEENADLSEISASVHAMLSQQSNITYGISKTPCSGLLVRMLGFKAEQLFDCLNRVAAIFCEQTRPVSTPSL